jgi:hypothetical protein
MIKKVILVSIVVYILGQIMASATEKPCLGWDCKEVTCNDGYAVLIPGVGYLPCEKWDQYASGDKSVIIKYK